MPTIHAIVGREPELQMLRDLLQSRACPLSRSRRAMPEWARRPCSRRAARTFSAGGRSNREIAGELLVSERTVEANLTRAYRKLRVRSRTELARRLPTD